MAVCAVLLPRRDGRPSRHREAASRGASVPQKPTPTGQHPWAGSAVSRQGPVAARGHFQSRLHSLQTAPPAPGPAQSSSFSKSCFTAVGPWVRTAFQCQLFSLESASDPHAFQFRDTETISCRRRMGSLRFSQPSSLGRCVLVAHSPLPLGVTGLPSFPS